jgi:hypothetical protein
MMRAQFLAICLGCLAAGCDSTLQLGNNDGGPDLGSPTTGDSGTALQEAGSRNDAAGTMTPDAAQDAGPDAAPPPTTDAGGTSAILFGGQLCDTWSWSGTAWTELVTPDLLGGSGDDCTGSVMAPFGGNLFLFGGGASVGSNELVWTWANGSWTYTDRHTMEGPPATSNLVMAPFNGQLVLLGPNSEGNTYAETWTWDGTTWTQIQVPGPEVRTGAVMAALDGKLVLFGGEGATGILSDTWTWDGTGWTALTAPGPSGRLGAVFAALDGQLVLFGGTTSTVLDPGVEFGDTWTWDGTAWNQVNVTGPSARDSAVMVPFDGSLFLFGGETQSGQLGDAWTWNGAAWSQVNFVYGPVARSGAVMGVQ